MHVGDSDSSSGGDGDPPAASDDELDIDSDSDLQPDTDTDANPDSAFNPGANPFPQSAPGPAHDGARDQRPGAAR